MNINKTSLTTYTILHHIELVAPPTEVVDAVSTASGVSKWWSPMTTETGGLLQVRFGDGSHGPDFRVSLAEPTPRVDWTCVAGPWKGMRLSFDILPHERGSTLAFRHQDWPEQNEFFGHCNAKWGFFLTVSLKLYLETGRGQPHPHDPSI